MTAQEEYIGRINRVIDHLNANLGAKWSLDDLAHIACFSPHHFHRVFKGLTGETVHGYSKRLRLEKAARLIALRGPSLTQIALDCGFESSADFSRSFKAHFKTAPSRFTPAAWRKLTRGSEQTLHQKLTGLPKLPRPRNTKVEIVDYPARHVAYVRITDSYRPGNFMRGFEALTGWAGRHGLLEKGMLLGMSQDDPDITPPEKCRYDMCITIKGPMHTRGRVGTMGLPRQRYARLVCQGDMNEMVRAWDWLYKAWLPQSGHQPADGPCIEEYRTSPLKIGWERVDLNMLVPVKAL